MGECLVACLLFVTLVFYIILRVAIDEKGVGKEIYIMIRSVSGFSISV